MPCYNPLKGYRGKDFNPSTKKRSIVFDITQAHEKDPEPLKIPCGRCIGCRLERSRQWAIRCMHEASLYDHNAFISLTYAPDKLPPFGNLVPKDHQDFMKRLRKRFGPGIRYYHCGEYGEQFKRPHYHTCLFNFDFPDKVHWRTTERGDQIYTSEILSELWPHGYHEIGSVTFNSAAYVARYIMKKVLGDDAEEHYEYLDEYGEYKQRPREYTTMSRRPGIGRPWLEKYMCDTYPSDSILVPKNGKKIEVRPPRYYDNQYELVDPFGMDDVRWERTQEAKKFQADNTIDRLIIREILAHEKLNKLKRSYE